MEVGVVQNFLGRFVISIKKRASKEFHRKLETKISLNRESSNRKKP